MIVNKLGKFLHVAKPRALQVIGAGMGGGAAKSLLDGMPKHLTSADCPTLPSVHKPIGLVAGVAAAERPSPTPTR